jgi:hypothetical protein
VKNLFNHRILTFKGVMRLLRITFISGPFLLFTTRLSIRHAAMMILLCTPALILVSFLTIPTFLFSSPEHHAYYEFANILTKDPAQWFILPFAALCSMIALAVPATASKPFTAVRS